MCCTPTMFQTVREWDREGKLTECVRFCWKSLNRKRGRGYHFLVFLGVFGEIPSSPSTSVIFCMHELWWRGRGGKKGFHVDAIVERTPWVLLLLLMNDNDSFLWSSLCQEKDERQETQTREAWTHQSHTYGNDTDRDLWTTELQCCLSLSLFHSRNEKERKTSQQVTVSREWWRDGEEENAKARKREAIKQQMTIIREGSRMKRRRNRENEITGQHPGRVNACVCLCLSLCVFYILEQCMHFPLYLHFLLRHTPAARVWGVNHSFSPFLRSEVSIFFSFLSFFLIVLLLLSVILQRWRSRRRRRRRR